MVRRNTAGANGCRSSAHLRVCQFGRQLPHVLLRPLQLRLRLQARLLRQVKAGPVAAAGGIPARLAVAGGQGWPRQEGRTAWRTALSNPGCQPPTAHLLHAGLLRGGSPRLLQHSAAAAGGGQGGTRRLHSRLWAGCWGSRAET